MLQDDYLEGNLLAIMKLRQDSITVKINKIKIILSSITVPSPDA